MDKIYNPYIEPLYKNVNMTIVGVLSDVNLQFIVQMFPLARIQFRTIQDM